METRTAINQHEMMDLISIGTHKEALNGYDVIVTNLIDFNWLGDDGNSLAHALIHDDRNKGWKILMKHSGMDFPQCCRYMQSHWSWWRENMSKILVVK